jgi:hypothetical protein
MASKLIEILEVLPETARLNDGSSTWTPRKLIDALKEKGFEDQPRYVSDAVGIYGLDDQGRRQTPAEYTFEPAQELPT